ncbi:MAG: hypothetical protein HQ596_01910 [Candidatus Saganbacteria bacterium]|nr:hypothetical protein [Candidatus Saganbacteria bacterium]
MLKAKLIAFNIEAAAAEKLTSPADLLLQMDQGEDPSFEKLRQAGVAISQQVLSRPETKELTQKVLESLCNGRVEEIRKLVDYLISKLEPAQGQQLSARLTSPIENNLVENLAQNQISSLNDIKQLLDYLVSPQRNRSVNQASQMLPSRAQRSTNLFTLRDSGRVISYELRLRGRREPGSAVLSPSFIEVCSEYLLIEDPTQIGANPTILFDYEVEEIETRLPFWQLIERINDRNYADISRFLRHFFTSGPHTVIINDPLRNNFRLRIDEVAVTKIYEGDSDGSLTGSTSTEAASSQSTCSLEAQIDQEGIILVFSFDPTTTRNVRYSQAEEVLAPNNESVSMEWTASEKLPTPPDEPQRYAYYKYILTDFNLAQIMRDFVTNVAQKLAEG